METGLTYRLCRALLGLIARIVPARDRDAWLCEWDSELRERWHALATRNELNGRHQMNLLRRTLGSMFDAAWLRRQITRDAEIVHDLRHGLRVLRRRPGFAATAVLVLALGTGVTVGIFTVIDALLIRSLPYADADRIVMLWQGERGDPDVREDVAPANCLDWRDRLASFAAVACADPLSFEYTGGGEPVVLHSIAVTEGFLHALGASVILGRDFAAEEHLQGRNRVIVITHDLWREVFGGDSGVIGRTMILDDAPHTVVGVLPRTFQPRLLETYNSRAIYFPKVVTEQELMNRGSRYWNAVGRLKPGVTLAQAQADLDAVSRLLAREYPRTNATVVARAQPLREHLAGELRPALRLLFAAAGLLLLIAAANVANLLLARAAERTGELSLRAAVGAGRARLVRQLLAESLLLATLGSAASLLVAWWTVRAIIGLSPTSIPSLATVTIDGRAIAFAVALTGVVALVVGIIPAWQSSGGRLVNVLRAASPGGGSSGRHPLRATIVIAEVALAMLLTTGATLLVRSFVTLLQIDPGFNPDRVIAMQVFAWDRNTTPEKRAAFFQQILARMESDPHVEAVGAVSAMPFIESDLRGETRAVPDASPDAREVPVFVTLATPGFFPAMRIALREGRTISQHDTASTGRVVVITESLARQLWPGTSAVGRRLGIRVRDQIRPAEIIGVAADVRHDGLDRPSRPEVFVPHAQLPNGGMTFVARTSSDPATVIAAMKGHIRAVDPAQAIYRVATADELVSNSLVERRFMLTLLAAFAVLAVVLAAIGIYGVISVATAQRTREFGVRIALGADGREILRMVFRQGAVVAGAGLTIGLAASLAFGGIMSSFLYGVQPWDPLTLLAAVAGMATVATAACVIPARRATRVDPLVALRSE